MVAHLFILCRGSSFSCCLSGCRIRMRCLRSWFFHLLASATAPTEDEQVCYHARWTWQADSG
ncbi:hypothetical protein PR003_g1778 [Phytophthora rubi]|uniref:Secreted protein n=1 Tax=Phytophthora rubi TaxID=129364 RepID=A0A6A3NNJ2_9STRA|nr:hypothetical protein PR002_g1839 [Phytophthora rubi]KAE9051143.1 hypothetical protein PR001_g1727 [Phytophthora rubi]KAE9357453.1 hypothetical protein PR003_g1778 [Phytophthora rubi]